jgi:peptidoglycan-associated lipoprotein
MAAIAVASCGSKPVAEAPVEQQPISPAPPVTQPEPVPERITPPVTQMEESPVVKEAPTPGLTAERKIYFDFDKSEIKPEFKATIEAHAKYLTANPNIVVTIEGHCDERGTREYNMALGNRRGFSVAQTLMLMGVPKNQVKVVSYGEERGDVEGHDESAWKWNRRAVFVYAE